MHRHLPELPQFPRLWRAVALLGIGLVVLLSLSAVSPALHHALHEQSSDHHQDCSSSHAATEQASDSHDADDHQCAVNLFAHATVHPDAAPQVKPCEGILRAIDARAFERLALAQPRFLHLPPQAPPAV